MQQKPPSLLRVKRKRGDDPLQALILEGHSTKKSKLAQSSPAFYFALSRADDAVLEAPILAETQSHHFVLPQDPSSASPQQSYPPSPKLNPTLSQMIGELNVSDSPAPRRRRRSSTMNARPMLADQESELKQEPKQEPNQDVGESQYVYDVYRLTSSEPFSSANHPVSQIGYIRFFDDDLTLASDDDAPSPTAVSDNEDSNAEDFYQNDYPSDEDAEGLYLPELGFDNAGPEDRESFDCDFDFANSDDDSHLSASYAQYADTDHNQYRDRIFGKLQRMIDEADEE